VIKRADGTCRPACSRPAVRIAGTPGEPRARLLRARAFQELRRFFVAWSDLQHTLETPDRRAFVDFAGALGEL